MRYIVADERPVTIDELRSAFKAAGPGYRLEAFEAEMIVHHGDHVLAHVTLNSPGDGLFDDERAELLEEAEEARGKHKALVLETLRAARQIVAVQVLHGTGESDSTLELLDPLWDWLVKQRAGMVQADEEGYWQGNKLILRVT